ncbi:MAG TPA: HAMP domain-containing sensor histidine kinase [Dongiaceae bacterium]|jgi:signal transduction histidine kinase|nr:HAMP domain-containing sensor histidine kinase [Dongiaceae bacterium]
MSVDALSPYPGAPRRANGWQQLQRRVAGAWQQLRIGEFWRDEAETPERVAQFRDKAIRLLLLEQWALLTPIAITAYFTGNSWIGLLVVGGIFHGCTSFFRKVDPIGLSTRSLIATGLLLDVLLLIYALTGTGSWQMDGGHMWVFAVWAHALGLLCWRSLLVSGTLAVLHHFVLVFLFPLWVFPDGANIWRVVLHAGVVALQLSVLCVFVFLIRRMLTKAEELESALAKSLAIVEEVSISKSRFLAHMSHELRTPLNAIIGFSDVMKTQMFGELSPRYLDYAANIHASGEHLHDLINDVLDLSRVEAGKHEIFEEAVEPARIVEVCFAMMSARAREGQIELMISIPKELPILRADPRALKQVLLNLLSNAIKYTPAGGQVVTSLHENENGLAVTVTDTGCGISQDALAKVFDPFQRGDSMIARKIEGTGLGLAISRKLMELHGGTLTLASRSGAGTTATALFPANRLIASR